ncbi:DUF3309 family protein [Methylobacterium nodulans]|nr:DUF3309 family protein [Methylobacterium nodulans]
MPNRRPKSSSPGFARRGRCLAPGGVVGLILVIVIILAVVGRI